MGPGPPGGGGAGEGGRGGVAGQHLAGCLLRRGPECDGHAPVVLPGQLRSARLRRAVPQRVVGRDPLEGLTPEEVEHPGHPGPGQVPGEVEQHIPGQQNGRLLRADGQRLHQLVSGQHIAPRRGVQYPDVGDGAHGGGGSGEDDVGQVLDAQPAGGIRRGRELYLHPLIAGVAHLCPGGPRLSRVAEVEGQITLGRRGEGNAQQGVQNPLFQMIAGVH